MKYVIIGVHRSMREVVGWAGKEGFLPLTSERNVLTMRPPAQLKVVSGEVGEELMKHITRRGTTTKYEFVLVPVVEGTTQIEEGRSEAGLILPHLH